MKELPATEWRWFVTDTHEVVFARGYKSINDVWDFKGHQIHSDNVYLSETVAVKAAKTALKNMIAFYKKRLDALNKRAK